MKWTELGFKLLSMLVVPLLLWGIKLEVNSAVQSEKITKLEAEVAAARPMSNTLGRVEEKIDATNKRLDDIKADLNRTLPPAP